MQKQINIRINLESVSQNSSEILLDAALVDEIETIHGVFIPKGELGAARPLASDVMELCLLSGHVTNQENIAIASPFSLRMRWNG